MANTGGQNNFQQTKILYQAMLVGQVLLGLVLWYLMLDTENEPELLALPPWLAPLLVLGGVAASYLANNRFKSQIPMLKTLAEKMEHFRRVTIVRCALQEGGNLFALVVAFASGNKSLLLWFALGVVAFLLLRPTIEGFAQQYELTSSERAQVEN